MGALRAQRLAVAVYAVNVGLASLVAGISELIAVRGRLAPDGALGDQSSLVLANGYVFAIFMVSAPIAFLSTTVAKCAWLLLLLGPRILRRHEARRSSRVG